MPLKGALQAYLGDLLEHAVFLAKAWVTADPSSELARTLMYYSSKVGEVPDEQAFIEAFIRAVPNSQEDVMILAQRFEQHAYSKASSLVEKMSAMLSLKRCHKGANVSDIEALTERSYQEIVSLRLT